MCSENTVRSVPSTPECCQLSVHKHSFSTPVHPVVVHVASYMRSLAASRGDTETYKEQKIEKGNKRSSQTKKKAEGEEVAAGEEGGATQHSGTHGGRNGI